VRLFNETQEALERQTATSDILKVIASSPSDVQPVFAAIAERSNRLVNGLSTAVYSIVDDVMHLMAFTRTSPEADAILQASFPRPLSEVPWTVPTRHGGVVELPDAEAEWAEQPEILKVVQMRGFRSVLFVPLLRDEITVGVIAVTRKELGRFALRHIQLLQTFADQAVIAIGNVRLFDEVQARTRDLAEALTHQTGSANILRVIASSPTNVEPVLQSIVESACELCEAKDAAVLLREGDYLWFRAHHGPLAIDLDKWPIGRDWASGRAVVDRSTVHIPDVFADEARDFAASRRLSSELSGTGGIRSILAVPLLLEGESIGAILLRRQEVQPYTEKQIALLKTFADQAVIAIGNVRPFDEVQQALERQTATADILKVIASSPSDVQPVFQAIAERSNRLVGGFATTVVSIVDDIVHLSAYTSTTPAADAALRDFYPRPLSAFSYSEDVRRGQIHRIVDTEAELADQPDALAMVRRRGWRSALWAPLLLEGKAIGVIGVTRVEAGPFADHHVEMLKTFADQAVIAISNVKLFEQVQERTRELSQSLDELRTAQDRLVQTEKLASLGQLTAGIAHEIKNPLNFVNNFSALSVELTEELGDLLKPAPLDDRMRGDVDELTSLIKDNLEKVVQHGKRADSIVKNMLLHSREGSGERRTTDINALLDESLNLAYHGARAEKPGFNITLQRDFDEGAGEVEAFPQEITRALLNLISNGFYAATRRKADNGHADFEPLLSAATKNLGGHVEIRIRDNGSGIPPEVKEKMFNPFFTTKPAGEGTGLGLSMTHDIVVKQHGGRIDVATEPGQFTEFTILLPRTIRR